MGPNDLPRLVEFTAWLIVKPLAEKTARRLERTVTLATHLRLLFRRKLGRIHDRRIDILVFPFLVSRHGIKMLFDVGIRWTMTGLA